MKKTIHTLLTAALFAAPNTAALTAAEAYRDTVRPNTTPVKDEEK